VPEVFEEADGLDGLAEAHLVGQDEAVVLAPGVQQEIYSINLKGERKLFYKYSTQGFRISLLGFVTNPCRKSTGKYNNFGIPFCTRIIYRRDVGTRYLKHEH
jgi:hypothetical protein